jgi:high-affinity iron transporter
MRVSNETMTSPVRWRSVRLIGLLALAAAVLGVLVWQGFSSAGNPDPAAPHLSQRAIILNASVLVFREGLEAILVLAAVSASFLGAHVRYRRPVAAGAGVAGLATVATWFVAIAVISAVNAPELDIQAATGLLAVVVLLVVMNWFFHRVYWTGWIAHHNRRRRELVAAADNGQRRTLLGLGLLGFTAVYREGVEVVLFLQNLRLQAGSAVVLKGVLIGLGFTAAVAVLTFVAHHRLPYKRMLVLTGVMLGFVLVVMVGESLQEMQLAGWIPTTTLDLPVPAWMGVWFALFPTVETLAGQFLAAALVIGSYVIAKETRVLRPQRQGQRPAVRPDTAPHQV